MYLNCKTYFSFRYGTISTKELVDMAVEHGVDALALNNINSTCDLWDFVKFCREAGIKPITGVEIRNRDQLLYFLQTYSRLIKYPLSATFKRARLLHPQ